MAKWKWKTKSISEHIIQIINAINLVYSVTEQYLYI
jgi:hypothetical protein